ncbi:MAG: oxygen-independent coproporphyrinogen III oxidase [Xanthomonadaceae bacterium]|nr:oxygen-independent coproporphyrinogen III oxidase [Xanthomonadaceae bacterium]
MSHARPPSRLPSAELIRRFDANGPRYTSYPTAMQFTPAHGAAEHAAAARRSAAAIGAPLSLYVHVPFCESPCFYCGCNRIISRDHALGDVYGGRLIREAALQAALLPGRPIIEQLHFGGGTPTFLSIAQLERLLDGLDTHFHLSRDAGREFSIEIDPRSVTPATLAELARLGFNRASFGIQDFDVAVQDAVNRRQTYAEVAAVIEAARAAGFGSLSADLIYGLPKQHPDSFTRTIDQVIALRPDRISTYSYAHVPERFKAQRQIRIEDLPDSETKLALLNLSIERLLAAGYRYIGMDHFALPQDELARAQRNGSLQRNFQGYATRAGLDLIGLGVSAISSIGDSYGQNARSLAEWNAAIDAGRLPVDRGLRLDAEDRLRRDVIAALMCEGRLRYAEIEALHEIDFAQHFAAELARLQTMADDGLVLIDDAGITVTPTGRYLLRAIAMPFDAYLPVAASGSATAVTPRYSRLI